MTRIKLTGIAGLICLVGLGGCVVEPARPVAIAPAPVVVPAPLPPPPPPVVVVRPRWRHRACPVGFHLGRYGHRCWPNR